MSTEMAVSGTVTGTLGAAVETACPGTAETATFVTAADTTALEPFDIMNMMTVMVTTCPFLKW